MRKQPEVTENIKSIIRDKFAMRPLMSVEKMRVELFFHGFINVNGGFLDWHFVSKTMRKVRLENIEKLKYEDRQSRLVRLKERHRIITDHLADIVEGNRMMTDGEKEARYPTPTERIMAANAIMKWETAVFFAEETAKLNTEKTESSVVIEKQEPIKLIAVETKPDSKKAVKKWTHGLSALLAADGS